MAKVVKAKVKAGSPDADAGAEAPKAGGKSKTLPKTKPKTKTPKGPMDRKRKLGLYILIVALAGIIIGVTAHPFAIAKVDAKGNIGPLIYGLDGDFSFHKIKYTLSVEKSSEGLAGSIGGDVSRDVEGDVFILKGFREFQGDVGIILDSYDKKEFEMDFTRREGTTTYHTTLMVTYSVEMNPWWIIGRPQAFKVDVRLVEVDDPLFEYVEIEHVEVQLWTDYVEQDETGQSVYDYSTRADAPLWEDDVSDRLASLNSTKSYDTEVTLEEDFGRVGMVGRIEATVHYTDDSTSPDPLLPFASTSHPNTINVYTVRMGKMARVVAAVLAGPLSAVALGIAGIGLILAVMGRRRAALGVAGTAGVIELLCTFFFYTGLTALGELLPFLGDDLTFNGVLAFPAVSGSLILAGAVGYFIVTHGGLKAPAARDDGASGMKFKVSREKTPMRFKVRGGPDGSAPAGPGGEAPAEPYADAPAGPAGDSAAGSGGNGVQGAEGGGETGGGESPPPPKRKVKVKVRARK